MPLALEENRSSYTVTCMCKKLISIIIPTYNRRAYLEKTLASLSNQTYDVSLFEVIVINDGSVDTTSNIEEENKFPYATRWIHQENLGRSTARNRGLSVAQGDLIVFIDDDRLCCPEMLNEHYNAHTQHPNSVVIGRRRNVYSVKPDKPQDIFIFAYLVAKSQLAFLAEVDLITGWDIANNFDIVEKLSYGLDFPFEYFAARSGSGVCDAEACWDLFVTSNASVHKAVLDNVGYFNEHFIGWGVEDMELGYRLLKSGINFVLNPNATNYHQNHPRELDLEMETGSKNYKTFCEIHPDVPVLLLWRKMFDNLNLEGYATLCSQWNKCNIIRDCNSLRADYYRLLKDFTYNNGLDSVLRSDIRKSASQCLLEFRRGNWKQVIELAGRYVTNFESRCEEQQSVLSDFPNTGDFASYIYLNNVGMCLLLAAKSCIMLGDASDAKKLCISILRLCSYSQYWDTELGIVRPAEEAHKLLSQIIVS